MPELPEVETICRGLRAFIPGRKISQVEVFDSRLRHPVDSRFRSQLQGKTILGAERRGKYILIPLEGEMALVELHKQVIDNILGQRNPEDFLLYTRDAAEAVRLVDQGTGVGAYFLDVPDLRQVLKLAQEGKTLPQKSTYFYPKPPSGMVFLRLDPNRRL